jgi:pimeloyl-ACP methyl ester carboxylesterase
MRRLRSGVLALCTVIFASAFLSAAPYQQAATPAAPPTLASAPDQQFTADDVTQRYRDLGSGTPVVLIHGYTAALESMAGVARTLPDGYRQIALDVRGFGRSSKFGDASKFGQLMVDDVIRLMDHLKLERAHLNGHSMGALIAANAAARYPARVSSATLVAGPFYADAATMEKETGRWLADLESGAGLVNFMKWLFPAMKPEMAGMVNAGAMKSNDLPSLIATLRSLPKLALAGLSKNGNTALLIAGTGDPLFPLSPAFATQSPGAKIVEVAGADHVSVITNPAAVTAIRERVAAR